MRVLLDDIDTGLSPANIADALADAARLAESAGRMVVDVYVDGVHWQEEDFDSATLVQRSASEVRFTTACPKELLRETFLHAAEAVLNADEQQRAAAKLLQEDRATEAYAALLDALNTWSHVQSAIAQGLSLGIVTRERAETAGISIDTALQSLESQLQTLKLAMSRQDHVAVSDCLLYEFPMTTRLFATMLAEFAELSTQVA
ncbi:MAG: hypothetical protein EXS10_06650 [Phycisphaerales bacterium]|nr:hypothetical protein [Phycisphaerales bacterium]